MGDAVLTSEVKEVLSRAECFGSALRLPPGQLDRKLYEQVDKALRNAGGKWNTKAKAHIFPTDAQPKLAAMLGTGVSVDEKKRDQAFFTPSELAAHVVSFADVRGHLVLEPSAGRGALADACMAAGAARVHCLEINSELAEHLAKKYFTISGDFLSTWSDQKYSRIVMNPPFTRNQDIAHVRHALKWLKPCGVLVAIMLNNQTRKGFMELVAECDPEIEEIERGAFKQSGTDISTLIVKIEL